MKKYFFTFISGVFLLLLLFTGFYGIGKYILPDVLGTMDVENKIQRPISGESVLHKKAPEFNIPDSNGKRTTLSQFFGTPTVIIFWSTWNKASADQISILDEYIRLSKIQSSLVNILAINSQEDPSVVLSFVRRGGYVVPVLLDATGDVSQTYNVKDFPTLYFISKDGVVNEVYTGILSKSVIVEKVDSLLKKTSVE